MKLRTVRVREFQSIWDSNAFEVDRATCLVGKNEAGKTAILQALYRLNPIVEDHGNFDVTDDYPRSEVEDYQQDVESGRRKHAIVVEATFGLDAVELGAIQDDYGDGVLSDPEIVISKGYARDNTGKCTLFVSVPVDEAALVKNLIESFELPETVTRQAMQCSSVEQLSEALTDAGENQDEQVASAKAAASQIERV